MITQHIEVLVEELSAEVCLRDLLPKILRSGITFQIHSFQGKKSLLDNLLNRLRGYSRWLPTDYRILVLVDRDNDECRNLKRDLEEMARVAGLKSLSEDRGNWQIVNRIAIEELEAWYFGDMNAVRAAFPKIPPTIERKAEFRDPDAIRGGTWEALERVMQKAGYFKTGLRKVEAARAISSHLDPERNSSHSFQVFKDALIEIANPIP